MRSKILALASMGLMMIVSARAFAASNGLTNGWVEGNGGLSVPTYHDTNVRAMWGFSAGAKLGSEYGLGAYYQHSAAHEDLSGGGETGFNYDLFGIQGTYHFEGEALGAYFGVRLGITKVHEGDTETSPINYGILGGYDYFFNRNFSLGGEVAVMAVGSGSDKGNRIGSFVMIDALAAVKFWF